MNIRWQDRQVMRFLFHEGTFQCIYIPSGLPNGLACFQQALDLIFPKSKWKAFVKYIDYVVTVFNTFEEHIRHFDEIVALAYAIVTFKIKNSIYFSERSNTLVTFLCTDDWKSKSQRGTTFDAQPQTNKTKLSSFLGFFNSYLHSIESFTGFKHPLSNRTATTPRSTRKRRTL